MAHRSRISRAALLVSLLTALLLSVAASSALAAASTSRRPAKTPKHHVKTVRNHGKKHEPKKIVTKTMALGATFAKPFSQNIFETASKGTAPDKQPTMPTLPAPTSAAATTHTPATVPVTATAAQATTAPEPTGIPGNWNVVLDSEFNGSSLNTNLWRTGWYGSGVTAPTNSYEADCYSPNNVTFPGDDTMHLNVTATPSTCGGETRPYTGSLVSTNPYDGRSSGGFQYTYGVLEARVYVPAADGNQVANWPAVWADGQSWPADGEDDLMEGLGGQFCYHFHDPLGGPGNCDATLAPGWHTFASDWQPGSVTYYYDGVDVGSITTGITSSPMYIILNNTVYPGEPTAEADSMQVAYVRVWQN
jgi:beta-glucanase (GH16 family)